MCVCAFLFVRVFSAGISSMGVMFDALTSCHLSNITFCSIYRKGSLDRSKKQ